MKPKYERFHSEDHKGLSIRVLAEGPKISVEQINLALDKLSDVRALLSTVSVNLISDQLVTINIAGVNQLLDLSDEQTKASLVHQLLSAVRHVIGADSISISATDLGRTPGSLDWWQGLSTASLEVEIRPSRHTHRELTESSQLTTIRGTVITIVTEARCPITGESSTIKHGSFKLPSIKIHRGNEAAVALIVRDIDRLANLPRLSPAILNNVSSELLNLLMSMKKYARAYYNDYNKKFVELPKRPYVELLNSIGVEVYE